MRDEKTMQEVKGILERLRTLAPGHSVEVRVPPYAAIQCGEGPKHTRGTPPNVVEMNAQTLVQLAGGEISWESAITLGAVHASGERSNISALFLTISGEDKIAP